jgi:F-type H+-transporting ATPase subunit c
LSPFEPGGAALQSAFITQSALFHRKDTLMDTASAKLIGAGLAAIALSGVGVGIGNIFSTLVSSIARNPAARDQVFGIGILGFALTEAVALYALMVAFLVLFVF